MDIPVIRLSKVFHVGTLNPVNLGANSGNSSQEGACLSVSLCPNAWSAIAKLGGQAHELRKEDGSFLDVTALLGDESAKAELVTWGIGQGYVRLRKLWRSWSHDSEADEWRYMLCKTRSDALEEARGHDDEEYPSVEDVPAPEGRKGVEPITVPVGTPKLRKLTGYGLRLDDDASDALAVAFAMAAVPAQAEIELDGVWWCEHYDPSVLSAPRGGIFPDRVKFWGAQSVDLKDVDDELELEGMPEACRLDSSADAPGTPRLVRGGEGAGPPSRQ